MTGKWRCNLCARDLDICEHGDRVFFDVAKLLEEIASRMRQGKPFDALAVADLATRAEWYAKRIAPEDLRDRFAALEAKEGA